ncbi:hypothetical protein B0H14DRAFT_3704673 [Mycena olivaceomarginata]|nr:hypothetical protein B0H14DRAFT_3704673 [Mycena olivaceomarginata]
MARKWRAGSRVSRTTMRHTCIFHFWCQKPRDSSTYYAAASCPPRHRWVSPVRTPLIRAIAPACCRFPSPRPHCATTLHLTAYFYLKTKPHPCLSAEGDSKTKRLPAQSRPSRHAFASRLILSIPPYPPSFKLLRYGQSGRPSICASYNLIIIAPALQRPHPRPREDVVPHPRQWSAAPPISPPPPPPPPTTSPATTSAARPASETTRHRNAARAPLCDYPALSPSPDARTISASEYDVDSRASIFYSDGPLPSATL